jgi:acetate kinase
MKKLFLLSLLLIGTLTFGQTKKVNEQDYDEPKEAVDRINKTLDSLSNIYKKKVILYSHRIICGDETLYLKYLVNNKVKDTLIKVGKTHLKTK